MLRSSIEVPEAIVPLVAALRAEIEPEQIWLFGSRARGDHRPDSDWDLLVTLPDHSAGVTPDILWQIQRRVGVPATIVAASSRELAESWGCPNTLGYDLAREGHLIHVRS